MNDGTNHNSGDEEGFKIKNLKSTIKTWMEKNDINSADEEKYVQKAIESGFEKLGNTEIVRGMENIFIEEASTSLRNAGYHIDEEDPSIAVLISEISKWANEKNISEDDKNKCIQAAIDLQLHLGEPNDIDSMIDVIYEGVQASVQANSVQSSTSNLNEMAFALGMTELQLKNQIFRYSICEWARVNKQEQNASMRVAFELCLNALSDSEKIKNEMDIYLKEHGTLGQLIYTVTEVEETIESFIIRFNEAESGKLFNEWVDKNEISFNSAIKLAYTAELDLVKPLYIKAVMELCNRQGFLKEERIPFFKETLNRTIPFFVCNKPTDITKANLFLDFILNFLDTDEGKQFLTLIYESKVSFKLAIQAAYITNIEHAMTLGSNYIKSEQLKIVIDNLKTSDSSCASTKDNIDQYPDQFEVPSHWERNIKVKLLLFILRFLGTESGKQLLEWANDNKTSFRESILNSYVLLQFEPGKEENIKDIMDDFKEKKPHLFLPHQDSGVSEDQAGQSLQMEVTYTNTIDPKEAKNILSFILSFLDTDNGKQLLEWVDENNASFKAAIKYAYKNKDKFYEIEVENVKPMMDLFQEEKPNDFLKNPTELTGQQSEDLPEVVEKLLFMLEFPGTENGREVRKWVKENNVSLSISFMAAFILGLDNTPQQVLHKRLDKYKSENPGYFEKLDEIKQISSNGQGMPTEVQPNTQITGLSTEQSTSNQHLN
jgi:uncharacterized protein YeaC (DUF1315 family)